jgi:hypothetical protein
MVSLMHMLVLSFTCTNPKQHLDDYYMMEKYMQTYGPQVRVVLRPEEWPDVDGCHEILPTIARVQPGHSRKARRMASDEPINHTR